VIREDFKDCRAHAYLNCCSLSCPPLPPHWLTVVNKETELNELVTNFVNKEGGVVRKDNG
jgi:hypothetical protein